MNVEGHIFWVADSKILKGCTGQGDTSDEAIKELEENEKEWIATAEEFGIPIPERSIKTVKKYSGKLSLRVSPYIHERAAEAANEQGISLNQFINDAVIRHTEDTLNSSRVSYPKTDRTDVTSTIIQFPSSKVSPYVDVKEELEEM